MCRYAITRILEHNHFRVTEAGSGADTIRLASAELPDLILLDVNLPDISGFEVCRRLKENPATERIPVLHISASYVRSGDRARGLESGADSYLVEPVEPEVLLATIQASLRARKAEDAARSLAAQWQSTFEAITDGVAIVDREGRIQRSNASMARLLGRSTNRLPGQLISTLWSGVAERDLPSFKAMETRTRATLEWKNDSKVYWISADPVMDPAGLCTGAVLIISDITERRNLEKELRESHKFESVATLAAGVAHDYNNLLTSIMGNASLMAADLEHYGPARERLSEILRASERAADLTHQLLAYSGTGRSFLQKVNLSALIRRMQKLIEAAVPKKIELEIDLTENPPLIEADAGQLQHLLMNLINNAAEAIGESTGTIRLAAGSDTAEAVYLEVKDSGCGMSEEVKARIFDPFYTTKFMGRGLGLAAAGGIARAHKAKIQVETAAGCGSTFRVEFPALVQPAPPIAPVAAAVDGPPLVLVVDDEDMIRRVAQTSLERRGYRVTLAQNGLEAIEKVRAHADIGLVLLDMTMSVMGGEEAFDAILTARPGIKIVVSTGYDRRDAMQRFARKRVAGYLQKPYTSRQLVERVQDLVGDPTREH
jgi:PAS domain S-box-containing protein